jgi:hypothetical protein
VNLSSDDALHLDVQSGEKGLGNVVQGLAHQFAGGQQHGGQHGQQGGYPPEHGGYPPQGYPSAHGYAPQGYPPAGYPPAGYPAAHGGHGSGSHSGHGGPGVGKHLISAGFVGYYKSIVICYSCAILCL